MRFSCIHKIKYLNSKASRSVVVIRFSTALNKNWDRPKMVKGFGTRKLTDRLIIALAFSVLLVIILMIFHINMYIEMSKHVFVASRPEHVARCRADYRRYFQSISCVFNDKYLFRFILHELQQIDEQLKWKTQGYWSAGKSGIEGTEKKTSRMEKNKPLQIDQHKAVKKTIM